MAKTKSKTTKAKATSKPAAKAASAKSKTPVKKAAPKAAAKKPVAKAKAAPKKAPLKKAPAKKVAAKKPIAKAPAKKVAPKKVAPKPLAKVAKKVVKAVKVLKKKASATATKLVKKVSAKAHAKPVKKAAAKAAKPAKKAAPAKAAKSTKPAKAVAKAAKAEPKKIAKAEVKAPAPAPAPKAAAPAPVAAPEDTAPQVDAKPARRSKRDRAGDNRGVRERLATVRESLRQPRSVTAPPPAIADEPIMDLSKIRKPAYAAKIMDELKQLLLAERARLVNEIRSLDNRSIGGEGFDETMGQAHGVSGESADFAAELIEQEIALNIRNIEEEQLQQIDEALVALERGHYGYCQGNGEPIELDRLRVKPTARYSMKFLKQQEGRR